MSNITPVTILMHHREAITTTNTGRIAHYLLKNSNIYLRGLIQKPLTQEQVLMEEHFPLYLFPSEKSIPLSKDLLSLGKKIQLIIPDGSWRQARRVSKREPFLRDTLHVHLPDTAHGIFFLRKKILAEGLSTLEAIARALGILESNSLQKNLEKVFRIMVERTLETRGKRMELYEHKK